MGAKDDSDAYKTELKQVFSELIEEIYTSEADTVSAKNRLAVLRNKYGIAYTDEAGILDSIIDRVGEESLTRSEAELYFELLNSGKLAEYRQAASNNDRTAAGDGTADRNEAGPASAGSDEQPPASQKPPSPTPAPSQQPVQGQQPSGGGGNPRG
jgi:hypothetical protein